MDKDTHLLEAVARPTGAEKAFAAIVSAGRPVSSLEKSA